MSEKQSQKISRINDVLYQIHKDISQELSASSLAKVAAYSEQHFHRVFKSVVGENVHQYIKRTRLEYAANQLMFDRHTTVLDIANRCGFSSVSSFSRAFKGAFDVSPGNWKNAVNSNLVKPYLRDPEVADSYKRISQQTVSEPELVELPDRHVAYVRHVGYNRSIKRAWQVLKAWTQSEGRSFDVQFGLHHSNPICVDLDKCRYVACVEIQSPIKTRTVVNQMTIPKGLYAKFHLTGKYGELLPHISLIQEKWLPESDMKMKSTPAYVRYYRNHFIEEDERFELDFCLPIGFY
ncbi:AraC family transcriptional regulator [Vibrio salinus]|uniref:AraC family transcriptional regulator n=1 Tax=Vibrio salinus TaxID=2899784 RepID=UPI001E64F816|nr:AraC family transcriptional regulator [Vibrio salinus]MCE0495821.1 AraC family transcriptional regulator [Vibrio salinus]